MMEHLYTKIHFINQTIYTTSSGIVSSEFNDLLLQLKKKSLSNESTVLCDIHPIDEALTLLKHYEINSDFHNALFTYYPFPLDMIKPHTLHLCIASFENAPQKIHQLSFERDNHYYRFGIVI